MILNIADWSRGGSIQSYTGNMTESIITSNSKQYKLYTITSSGTLTVKGKLKNADVWLCGGGANGATGGDAGGGLGGGGAFCAQYDSQKLSGTYTIAIAGGGGNSSITSNGNVVFSASGATGANGGTGGGGSSSTGGTGDGIPKYPFGDSTTFKCHCAGGGGGSGKFVTYYDPNEYVESSSCAKGGNGGSNGAAGGRGSSPFTYEAHNAPGGSVGGGTGGSKSRGSNATFYGSGGGGGGADGYGDGVYPYNHNTTYSGGSGYQGVVYLLIPTA